MATFVVLGLMALGQLSISFFPKNRVNPSLAPVLDYLGAHPFLKVHPEVDAFIQANGGHFYTNSALKPNPRNFPRQQAQLNGLSQAFLAQWAKHPIYKLGFRAPFAPKLSLFTYFLISSSFLLFLWNAFILYVTAPYIEDRWGRVYFSIFLLGSAFLGALGHSLHAAPMPLVGASSLVAGALGAYAVILDDHRIAIRPIFSLLERDYLVPAWGIFLVWLVGTGIIMILTAGTTKLGSASWASLFYPFGFGLLTAGVIRWKKLEKKLYRSPFDRLEKDQQYLVRIDRELRIGSPKKALTIMWEACRAYPDRLDFLQPCWDQAIRTGQLEGIETIGKSLLNHYFRARDFDRAWFLLCEIEKYQIPISFPPDRICAWSESLFLSGRGLEAGQTLVQHAHPIPSHAPMRDQILQLAMDSDPPSASQLIQLWQQSPKASPDDLQVLERMAAQLDQELPQLKADEIPPIPIVNDHPLAQEDLDPFASSHMTKIKLAAIQPIALHKTALSIRMPSGIQKRLPFAKILALSAFQLRHLSGDCFWIMDIHLDDPFKAKPQHVVLRIHSNRLQTEDPLGQRLARGQDAFVKLGRWLAKGEPRLLPGFDLFSQISLPEYPSINAFEKDVYDILSGDHYL